MNVERRALSQMLLIIRGVPRLPLVIDLTCERDEALFLLESVTKLLERFS